jgi:hypothetical protein
MAETLPREPFAGFINQAHSDIRTATINSQAWSEAAQSAGRRGIGLDLYWYPVEPDLHREVAEPLRNAPQRSAHA